MVVQRFQPRSKAGVRWPWDRRPSGDGIPIGGLKLRPPDRQGYGIDHKVMKPDDQHAVRSRATVQKDRRHQWPSDMEIVDFNSASIVSRIPASCAFPHPPMSMRRKWCASVGLPNWPFHCVSVRRNRIANASWYSFTAASATCSAGRSRLRGVRKYSTSRNSSARVALPSRNAPALGTKRPFSRLRPSTPPLPPWTSLTRIAGSELQRPDRRPFVHPIRRQFCAEILFHQKREFDPPQRVDSNGIERRIHAKKRRCHRRQFGYTPPEIILQVGELLLSAACREAMDQTRGIRVIDRVMPGSTRENRPIGFAIGVAARPAANLAACRSR